MLKNKAVLFKIVLFLLALFIAITYILHESFSNIDTYTTCADDISSSDQRLLSLIAENSNLFIEHNDVSFSDFQSAFRLKLRYVDMTTPNYVAFNFASGHPGKMIKIVYCEDDQYLIPPDHFVTEAVHHVRIEHLGINGEGYIQCTRIQDKWFYVESFLPT